jgi:hypothetical protein
VTWAGHGVATTKHRGRREPDSTGSRPWIRTSTLAEHRTHFRNGLVRHPASYAPATDGQPHTLARRERQGPCDRAEVGNLGKQPHRGGPDQQAPSGVEDAGKDQLIGEVAGVGVPCHCLPQRAALPSLRQHIRQRRFAARCCPSPEPDTEVSVRDQVKTR